MGLARSVVEEVKLYLELRPRLLWGGPFALRVVVGGRRCLTLDIAHALLMPKFHGGLVKLVLLLRVVLDASVQCLKIDRLAL